MATSTGFGFTCRFGDLLAQKRAGKQFVTITDGAMLLQPRLFTSGSGSVNALLFSGDGRMLVCPMDQIKELSGGGKGVTLMGLDEAESLVEALPCGDAVEMVIAKRGGKYSTVGWKSPNGSVIAPARTSSRQ